MKSSKFRVRFPGSALRDRDTAGTPARVAAVRFAQDSTVASHIVAQAYCICDRAMRTWQTIRCATLIRHCHAESYAALVLSGAYEEAGDQGRFQVEAGNVILHDCFEAHLNRFRPAGARILNLPLSPLHSFRPGVARIRDIDLVIRTAELDKTEAAGLLHLMIEQGAPACADWPDELAAGLVQNPSLKLSFWARHKGLAPWTVSRGFAKVFGIPPEAFRARARARCAWRAIRMTREPLARIAAGQGFADQSHMTRSVAQVTGMTPQAWRAAANGFKTCGGAGV
jgi:AraC-like DNA-binding protein